MRRLREEPAVGHHALVSADMLSSSIIRPSTSDDAPEIAVLLAEAGLHPNISVRELQWKYWDQRTDWPGPRSIVMLRGTRIIAHAGICPGVCVSLRGELQTIHLVDWAARVDAAGAGVALMKHVARTSDALIAIGGSAQTLRILPLLGFRTTSTVSQYVRPLRPLSLITRAQGAGWKRLPRALRGLIWAKAAPPLSEEYSVRRVALNEIHRFALEWPTPNKEMAVFNRTIASIRHTLACPSTPMELYAWNGRYGQRGYFILGFAPSQARLLDCWTASADARDWHDLLDAAVWVARNDTSIVEIVCYASDDALRTALEMRGFRARGSHPIQWLPRPGKQATDQLRVQMLDNDAGYTHHGSVELWT